MKRFSMIFLAVFLVVCLRAQEGFTVPELSSEQKLEVRYNHVISYCVTGISFAKSQNVSAEDYGRYIGKLFIPFWNKEDGFPAFTGGIMYILAGLHPANDMEIIEQESNKIKFKLKNVTMVFSEGPFLGVTAEEFLDCSYGIISELAEYMNVDFTHKMNDEGWYIVTLAAK
jgi:hypothetical protein